MSQHGEEFSNTIQVKVDGAPLPADILPLLVGGYVDDSSNVPDMFLLRFTDVAGTVLPKGGFKIGATIEISAQTTQPSGPQLLLKGEVTALEVEVDERGLHTVVRGLDVSHRLFRGTRTEAYIQVKASDIAQQVAGRHGLPVEADDTRYVLDHVTQAGVNDWDFLRRLASEHDRVVTLSEGKLRFSRRPEAARATGQADAGSNPLVLEAGANLMHLRGTVTSAGQVPSVEVRGWDPKSKRAVISTQPAKTTSAAPDSGVTPSSLARDVRSAPYVLGLSTLEKQDRAAAIATSLADHLAGGFVELEGTARGNSQLRAGTPVRLVGVGPEFTGKYVLTSTRHEFSPGAGYTTAFCASNTSERTLYGTTNAVVRERALVPGVVPAVVTNNNDPENQGRVKIKLPWLSDTYESQWARTVQAGAGASRGTVLLPEVNDEVLVAFAQGDLERPYVIGGLYNGVDKPPGAAGSQVTGGQVVRRGFVSRTGMVIEMMETPSDERIELKTSSGMTKIVLTHKPATGIEITTDGPIKMTGSKGIALDGGSGDITLKGVNVKVDASQSMSTKATSSVSIAASAGDIKLEGLNAELKASMNAKVTGGAQAEVSGGATTTIKGGLVRIN